MMSSGGFYHSNAVSGVPLSAQLTLLGRVLIYDESGHGPEVTTADVRQSNGVIHVIDKVLLPK